MTTNQLLKMARRIPRDIEKKEAPTIETMVKDLQADIIAKIQAGDEKLRTLQIQVDAIDTGLQHRHTAPIGGKSLVDQLKENDQVSRLLNDRKGRAVITLKGDDMANFMERKTTITSAAVGVATSGVLQIDRIPGITQEARQQLFIRDLLIARPTTMQVVDFVKVNSPMTTASPQPETFEKFQNQVTFVSASEKVRTLATWIPAARQVLDDFSELANFLDGSLRFYVDTAEELQILSGDGTGENLHGFIPQASAFNTQLLSASAGWNKIDMVGRAVEQIMVAKELKPNWIVLHPTDWWGMRLTKDGFGRYILGDPTAPLMQSALFDLVPVVTTSIASGTFLVGSGNQAAAELRDRMEMIVEISTEHSDYFTKNLVAIRAEKRVALAVKRPGSYITGSFSSSPAGQ